MSILLYEDLLSGETSLILILDAENDGSGGEVDINFNCLPSSAYIAVSDDGGELSGSAPNIVGDFFWSSCCTDGGVIGGVGCGHSVTIDPDIVSGIDIFTLVYGTPTSPEFINLAEIDCPITINCGGTACCEEAFEFEADIEDATCSLGTDGSIDLTLTCAAEATFEWSNGDLTEDLSDITTGVYQVTITDGMGCMLSDSYTVGSNEIVLNIDGLINNIDCWNDVDGSILIDVGNSTNHPFSFIWSNGETTQNLSNLDIGTYTVTVTDAFGCMGIQGFTITQPNELSGMIINVTQPIAPNIHGSAGTQISGGSPPYTYNWDNGETNPTATALEPGIHNVTIVDANGCETILTVEIIEPLSANIDVNEQFCNVDCEGSIDIQPIGGLPPYYFSWSNGATSSSISGVCSGFYFCTIIDDAGSFYQVDVYVGSNPDIFLNADFLSTVCDMIPNGYIDLTITGGLDPYSFNWSNGSNSEDISQLSSGTYQVTVTDFNNCTAEETFLITESLPFTFNYNITPADCSQPNGNVILDNFQGEYPYTYQWSSGETTESIVNKSAGNYTVTITDNLGCSQIHVYDIPNSQGATINADVQNISCDNGADGSISINVNNGSPPFIYSWSSGDSTSYIDSLSIGDYAVTITDNINCKYTSSYNLSSTSYINADTTIFDETCVGLEDGIIQYNILNGFGPYQYNWSNGAIDSNVDSLSPGLYHLDVIDSLGCLYQNDFIILQGNTASFVDSVTHNLCTDQMNGSIQISNIGDGPFTYEWDNMLSESTLNNLSSGVYTVTATDTEGCKFEKQFQINEPPPITNIFELIQPGCNDDTLGTATAIPNGGVGNYSFSWSNGKISNTIMDLKPGPFTVTISDNNDCIFVDSIIILNGEPLQVNALVDSINCFGDFAAIEIIPLTGVFPFQFHWDDGSDNQIRNDLIAGVHSVVVTDDIGCTHDLSFVLDQPDSLSSTIIQSISPTSSGGDGVIQINIIGGSSPYSIQWSNGLTDVLTIDNLDYGTYSYSVVDVNGCISTGEIVFDAIPLTAILDISSNVCFEQCIGSINLEILGGAMPYSFQWSNGSQDNTINQLCNGLYAVTIQDNIGNSITYNDLLIDSPPLLTSSYIAQDESCIDLNDGTISIEAYGGTPPYDYYIDGITSTSLITDLLAGDYFYEVIDSFGCITGEQVRIENLTPLLLDIEQQNIDCDNCNGGVIDIKSDNINSYDIIINGTSYGSNNTISIDNLAAGNYAIQYMINDDCIQDVSNVIIVDEQLFDISFNPDMIEINLGEDFSFDIIVSDPLSLIKSIDWSSNSNINCEEFYQENYCALLTGTTTENDLITITVTLINGCTYEYLIPIEVKISTEIHLPTIFSPNGDGINDVFTFQNNTPILEIISFNVFDRWGNTIFNQNNVSPISFEGWDGKFNSQYVQSGVYIYSFTVVLLNGQTKQFIGDLTIVN
jgi:gliding motility-associated-like protein